MQDYIRDSYKDMAGYEVSNLRSEFFLGLFSCMFPVVIIMVFLTTAIARYLTTGSTEGFIGMISAIGTLGMLSLGITRWQLSIRPFLPFIGKFWVIRRKFKVLVLERSFYDDNVERLLTELFQCNLYHKTKRIGSDRFTVILFKNADDAMIFKLTVA